MDDQRKQGVDEQESCKAEAETRRRLDELDQIYKNSPVGLMVIDRDLRYVRINERMAEIDGRSVEDQIGRTVGEVVPGLAARLRNIYQTVLDTGEPVLGVEVSGETPGAPDKLRHWLASYFPLTADAGEVIGILGAVVEITERREAEEALRESTRILKLVLDTIPVAVWWKDHEGVFLGCNRYFAENAALESPDQIIGKTDFDMPWTQEQAERFRADDRAVMESGIPKLDYEERQATVDGGVIWVRTSKVPLRNTDGEIIGVLGTFEDITERREAVEALKQSEAFLTSVIEYSPISTWVSDDKGTVIRLNQACRDLFHLAGDEIVGKYNLFRDNVLEDQGLLPQIRRVFDKGETVRFTLWYETTRVGSYGFEPLRLFLDATISPVTDPSGRVTNAIVQHVNLTDRERAESERRALEQRLEEHKRKFYRETILSVTDGKLDICEARSAREYVSEAQIRLDVREPRDAGRAREVLEAFCASRGLAGDALGLFIIGTGEAITNALKHAGRGRVYAGERDSEVWIAVRDRGSGIESLVLPRAVLWRGYSTKPSLGLGYSIMLNAADRICLTTGPQGTTVILTKSLADKPTVSLDAIPDTWNRVPAGPDSH